MTALQLVPEWCSQLVPEWWISNQKKNFLKPVPEWWISNRYQNDGSQTGTRMMDLKLVTVWWISNRYQNDGSQTRTRMMDLKPVPEWWFSNQYQKDGSQTVTRIMALKSVTEWCISNWPVLWISFPPDPLVHRLRFINGSWVSADWEAMAEAQKCSDTGSDRWDEENPNRPPKVQVISTSYSTFFAYTIHLY